MTVKRKNSVEPKNLKKKSQAMQELYKIVISPVTILTRNLGIQTVINEISRKEKFQRKKYTGVLRCEFGKSPHSHQVTWNQPINMLPVINKRRAEKPTKVCTNKIALQTCSQSA